MAPGRRPGSLPRRWTREQAAVNIRAARAARRSASTREVMTDPPFARVGFMLERGGLRGGSSV
jgi:hypothetical protein